jgi:hypothetical protein
LAASVGRRAGLIAADDDEYVVVAILGEKLADELHLGDGAALVEGILDDDAVALQHGAALGTGEHGDIDAGGVETGGANRAVHTRANDENSGVETYFMQESSAARPERTRANGPKGRRRCSPGCRS